MDRMAQLCCANDSQNPFIIVIKMPHKILQGFDTIYPDKGPKLIEYIERVYLWLTLWPDIPMKKRQPSHIYSEFRNMGL